MTGYQCPVAGCGRSFRSVDSVVAHVAGRAQRDSEHAAMRDSDDHNRQWYENNCADDRQATL